MLESIFWIFLAYTCLVIFLMFVVVDYGMRFILWLYYEIKDRRQYGKKK